MRTAREWAEIAIERLDLIPSGAKASQRECLEEIIKLALADHTQVQRAPRKEGVESISGDSLRVSHTKDQEAAISASHRKGADL